MGYYDEEIIPVEWGVWRKVLIGIFWVGLIAYFVFGFFVDSCAPDGYCGPESAY